MRSKFSLHPLLAAFVLIAAGYADNASAHSQNGSLGKKATATDVYQVSCYDAGDGSGTPVRLIGEIKGIGPVSPVFATVQIEKDQVSVTTTDTKTGDRKLSREVSNYGGPGTYTVSVSKSSKPGKPPQARAYRLVYQLSYHCFSATQHAGTSLVMIQNQ